MKIFRSPCQCNLGPIPDMDESAGMEVEEPGHVRARTQPIDNHGRTDSGGWANKSSILLWKRGGWCLRDSSKPCSSPDARTPAGSQCLRGRARTLARFEVTSGVGVVLVLDGHVLSVNIVPHHPFALEPSTTTIILDGKHGRAQKWESPEASSHSCLSQKSPLGRRLGFQRRTPPHRTEHSGGKGVYPI